MAGNRRDVEVDIIGRDRFSPAAKSAGQGADAARRKMDGLKDGFGKLAAAGAGLGIAVMGAARVLDRGLAMSLQKSSAQLALGEQGYARLTVEAERNAHAIGMSRAEFIAAAGSSARLATNLGFTKTEAAGIGAQLPDLAAKLSLLSGGTTNAAEASDMLSSALAGEFDPLQRLGIAISAARVEQEAATIAKKRAGQVTTDQAKALAVLEIVTRQTTDANKLATTEAGRQAQKVQEAKAAWKEFGDTLVTSVTPALTGTMNTVSDTVDTVSSGSKLWRSIVETVTPGIQRNTEATKEQKVAVDATKEAADAAARAQDKLALETEKAAKAARTQSDNLLGSRDAMREYQAALDGASETLKKNGRTLDITTEKGRANQAALDGIASAALRQQDAMKQSGASQKQLDGALSASRAALESTAVKFGMTREAARRYADAVLGIPKVVTTQVNVSLNQARVQRIRSELADLRSQGYSAGQSFAHRDTGTTSRVGGPSDVTVTTQVMLDGAPFYSMTRSAVEAATSRAAHRARVGRR